MADDGLDDTLRLQIPKSNAGQGTVDLETVHKNRHGYQLVGSGLLEDSVVQRLVKDDVVLGLVLDLSLGPLLLRLLASRHSGGGLSGLRLLNLRGHLLLAS